MVQCLGHQIAQRAEEGVGGGLFVRAHLDSVDRPAQRVDHHLPDQRRDGEDPGPVPGAGDQCRVEHHRDGLDVGIHHGLMFQAGRDPRGLLRGEQIVRGVGLDLDDTVQGVFDLMHLMEVPAGDQRIALIEVTTAERMSTLAQCDQSAGRSGRFSQVLVRKCRDGHEDPRYNWKP